MLWRLAVIGVVGIAAPITAPTSTEIACTIAVAMVMPASTTPVG
jgi:hypothetical protein